MQQLSNVWNQVEALLSQNISLIPVRDKQIGDHAPKTAYLGWKKHQSEIITKEELWSQLEKLNTTAIAIICGKVSGNLEVIDVDVKNKPGIDAILLTQIQTLYPELFKKLRIHKTPSGGCHLLYRIADGVVPGNLKLAGREATDDELLKKPKSKTYYYLETRGEGGYIVAPPSLGYTIQAAKEIPVITWEQRCALIELCVSFSEIVKKEKTKSEYNGKDIYSENPFDHFNHSPKAADVLTDNGWKFIVDKGGYLYFGRPDGKQNHVHATFNKAWNLYYFFTTNSEFQNEQWLSPSTVLATLKFNGDKKQLYRFLVDNGYGKLNPDAEIKIVNSAALYGKELPKNISEGAKYKYEQIQSEAKTKYPHGIFWEQTTDAFGNILGYEISREKLYSVAAGLGFRLFNEEVCCIDKYIVKKSTERFFFDTLKKYIQEDDADEYEKICNQYEYFLQKSGTFTISRIELLNTDNFIKATKKRSYKFFANCYIEITAQEIKTCHYENIKGLIWESQIQNRTFETADFQSCLYYKFLTNAIGITDYLKHCIGYLAHEFKDEDMGYIIVLTEQCPDPKQGGGTGKNIFSALFAHTTSIKNIPGTQVQYNEKLLQSWNFERIFSISDVPKRFDFSFLKELSTGTGILKKLWKNELTVTSSDMPKFIVSTNYSFEVSDGGLKRRIQPIEFTDFFTKSQGVNTYYGAMFPLDWTTQDWLGYDNFIIHCIQKYLMVNGKITSPVLTDGGWIKQFEQEYGVYNYQFITENIDEWQRIERIKTEMFQNQYDRFCNENGINIKFRSTTQKINLALAEYCSKHEIHFEKSIQLKENNVNCKFKIFSSNAINTQSEADFDLF